MTPLVRMVEQRHRTDCGVSALAMLLGVSYEDALIALGGEKPTILERGVWLPEMQRAAARMGVTLKRRDTWSHEDDGIVRVANRYRAHVLLLRRGFFWDTDLTVWEPETYQKATRFKVKAILVREDS